MEKMREALQEAIDAAEDILADPAVQNVYKVHLSEEEVDSWQAALTPSPWIPCAERLPTEADADCNGQVWIHHKRKGVISHYWGDVSMGYVVNATHWMPTGLTRPEPPEVERWQAKEAGAGKAPRMTSTSKTAPSPLCWRRGSSARRRRGKARTCGR